MAENANSRTRRVVVDARTTRFRAGSARATPAHSHAENEEGDHQTEEPHGFRQGKAQNGIGEELLLERRVPGIADNQATKHCSNASP